MTHPTNIEYFDPDGSPLYGESAYKLEIRKITLDDDSIARAAAMGKTLRPIDGAIWSDIWSTNNSNSQESSPPTQTSEALSHNSQQNLPTFKRQKITPVGDDEDDEEEDDDDDDDDEEEEEEEEVEGGGEEEGGEEEEEEEDDEESEGEDRGAVDLMNGSDADSNDSKRTYDVDQIEWALANGADAGFNVEVVEESLKSMNLEKTRWMKKQYIRRDIAFYEKEFDHRIIHPTDALLKLSKMPVAAFKEWVNYKTFFISGKRSFHLSVQLFHLRLQSFLLRLLLFHL